MTIYTSYFGALKKLPQDFAPIAICGKMMFPWSGLRYPKLAPKRAFFDEWKRTGDNDYYIQHFYDEVLLPLNPREVISELFDLVGDRKKTICLMCYETPEKFCHRHLVADWLNGMDGITCMEWEVERWCALNAEKK